MTDEPVAEKTAPKQLAEHCWEPGQSGNPAGRPRGARSKLTEAFLNAMHDDFAIHGIEAVAKVRDEKPADYLRTIAALAPKVVEGSDDPDSPPVKTSLKVTFGD